jgi:predicted ATP-grasp superfamily ATP-dependent carboligase
MIASAAAPSGKAQPTLPHLKAAEGALVIGGDYRALGVVRSLGRRGIPVWVLRDDHAIAASSRYSRRNLHWPAVNEAEQANYLLDLAAHDGIDGWVVFPSGDEAAALLAHHHARLSAHYRLTVPPWEVTRWAYDKRRTYELASEIGLPIPWTYCPASRAELATLDCPFPVVLKPAHKERVLNRLMIDKAWRAEDRPTLLARYDEACAVMDPALIVVQELVPGGGETQFSYAALCVEGCSLASLVARRTRQYPADFGRSSTYVETIEDPGIRASAERLLAAMGYTGLVEVEFKRDPRSGGFKLLDVNPRVWGWHTLGKRAGVDFPYLYWRLLRDEPVTEIQAQAGVRWIHFLPDLLGVLRSARAGNIAPRAYLRSVRFPLSSPIFAVDDPLPALAEVPLTMSQGWRRRWAQRTGESTRAVFEH